MRNLMPGLYGFLFLVAASSAPAAAAAPSSIETGEGIHSAALTPDGWLEIRLTPGLRGYGDRAGQRTVTVSAHTITGEEEIREDLRLHRGQTYQHIRVADLAGDDGLVWTVELTRD